MVQEHLEEMMLRQHHPGCSILILGQALSRLQLAAGPLWVPVASP